MHRGKNEDKCCQKVFKLQILAIRINKKHLLKLQLGPHATQMS